MVKKLVAIIVLVLLVFQGVAFAASGATIMDNTIYGGIVGGLLGGAWYLLDQDEAGKKLSTSVGIGLIAGFLLGLTDVSSMVELEDGEMHVGIPPVYVLQNDREILYLTSLLESRF
jgi:hypothetical protein